MEKEDKDAMGSLVFFGLVFVAVVAGTTVNHYHSFHKAEEVFAEVMGQKTFDTEDLGDYNSPYFSYALYATPENGARGRIRLY